ncbi:MAG TPA: hypothetical protein VLS93_08860 [Anaeromyxobacteraceae bacterium]|nr:hypothetical protein [Anaeromyxobacteraceae bacterium]
MTARRATSGKAAGRGRAGAAPLPDPGGDAPLGELSRDRLSVFLYVALLPEETREIAKSLGLRVPGFRTESLSDVELCDMLADEIRTGAEDARQLVVGKLAAAFGRPPLPGTSLDAAAADDLLALGTSDHGLAMGLWRVLADPAPAVRERAVEPLDRLVQRYYGPAPEGEAPAPDRPQAAPGAAEGRVAELERKLERARGQAEEAREKAEAQRDKIQAQLREARAREAQAVDEAARAREAAQEAQRARERAEASLAAAQATDAAQELQRARSLARDLEGKMASLEARLARAAEREAEQARALEEARARPAAPAAEAQPPPAEADEPEEAPAAWLMPVFTREFYDSLEGWDRRIQRAAFKQANLLAQDVRHPSLRALPLEGLPGYYRVRVATDVRLLYRRPERQNTVEILSLIDREDLDRYIKQAKTR